MKLGLCECGCRQPTTVYKGQRRRFVSGHNAVGKPSRRRNGRDLVCTRCGNSYYAQAAQTETRRYCSTECRDDHRRDRTGPASPSYRRVQVACAECGEPVHVQPNALRRRPNQYCSPACGRLGQRRGISGAREITAGKKLALVRDGRRCRLCDFDLVLHVHHIVPRARGGSDDVDNLITLCPNHHAMVHRGLVPSKKLRAALSR